MKTKVFIILSLFLSLGISAQRGTVNDQYTLESKIMKQTMHYSVYLPEGYNTSNRSYPVLYLLHGYGGNYTNWITTGEVNRIVSAEIACGNAPEMIIIMPDGGNHYYVNSWDNSVRYEDYFFEEFIPHIEKQFRIMSQRTKRAISGLSMGGYGALYFTLKHPDIFGACYAFSASTTVNDRRSEEDKAKTPEYYTSHTLTEIVKKMEFDPTANPRQYPAILLDCGDDDVFIIPNSELFAAFKDRKYPAEFRVRDGGHTWIYWRTGLPEALKFIGIYLR